MNYEHIPQFSGILPGSDCDQIPRVANTMIADTSLGSSTKNDLSILPSGVASYRPFVRVLLSDVKKTFMVPTIVMLDSGSDTTFIDEYIRKKAFIKGYSRMLTMGGVNCTSTRNITIRDIILTNPETNKSFRLNQVGCLNMGKGI